MNSYEQAKRVVISCDHAGFDLKERVKQVLADKGYQVKDFGPATAERMDYPDAIHPLAKAINDGEFELGIIICGSGNGVAMTANKYPNVRAAISWSVEIAELSRLHNDANIISLPARFISEEVALACVNKFLTTEFEGGRHATRVNKIAIKQ
ncbi:MAG: ribose 5-phosphate isomerase B [Flavobacteriales bacterium]|nr:ribose 5-phosphate isomerase B [Flavobacteriales bacterium]